MKFSILENTKHSRIIKICSVRNCIFLNHFKGNFYLSLMFYMKSPFFLRQNKVTFTIQIKLYDPHINALNSENVIMRT